MTRSTRLRAIIALTAVTALSVAACGSSGGGASAANTPGVTSNSILLGSTQPLTGVAAPGYSEIAPAMQAYFDYINANGGINGRKITLKYLDDQYNPTNTVALTKQLILQDKVFALLSPLGTPTVSKTVDFVNSEKVPQLFIASGCECWNAPTQHPETFGFQTDYVIEGKVLGQYLKQKFPGKTVGVFYQDDDFGTGGLQGITDEVPSNLIVSKQPYQPGNTDITAQATALANAKPDVVVLFTVPAYTALFRLQMLKLNFNPQLAVSNVGIDPTTVEGLLSAFAKQAGSSISNPAQLINGIISDAYLPSLGATTNSWIALFKKIHDTYIPQLPFDGNVETGMAYAYTFAEAAVRAGKNLTRQGIVQAVEQGNFQGPGLVPFRFSTTDHAGYSGVQVGSIANGVFVPTGTPQVTDDGNTSSITPFNGTQATAPANGIPSD